MGSLVAELAEKLSAATNSLDFDEQTMFLNTSANTVGIGTNAPASKLDVRGTVQVGVDDTGYDVKFFGATAGNYFSWDENVNEVNMVGTIKIKEQADAHADTAAFGQIWVNTATPCELYFTTDAGNDVQITSGSALSGAFDTDAAQVFNESGADVDFRIESDDNTHMFFVDGSEDMIGIGTSAPAYKLDVMQDAETYAARIWNDGADGNRDVLLLQGGGDTLLGNTKFLTFADGDGTEHAWIQGAVSGADGGLAINTTTADANNLVIDEAGFVGIGTNAPSSQFHVYGNSNYIGQFQQTSTNTHVVKFKNSYTGCELFVNSDTTKFVGLLGDADTGVRLMANDSLTTGLTVLPTGFIGANVITPAETFHVKRTAAVNDGVMRVEHTHATGYATVSFQNNSIQWNYGLGGSQEGNVGNQIYWHYSGHKMKLSTGGNLWIAGSYSSGSDVKMKKDIVDLPYGLDEVLDMQPRSFKWKKDDSSSIGFIAQEIETIIPELVEGEDLEEFVPDDPTKNQAEAGGSGKSINYPVLTSVLCKAIQELSTKVKALEDG